MKKLFISCICMALLLGATIQVNAAELKTELQAVKMASETKYLENDQGFISKTIVDSDKNTGEVTIELKLSNTKKETEEVGYDSTEVIFVIDNSFSMEEIVSDNKTRRDVVISSAKEFASSLFKDVNNLKIGLVYYYGWDSEDEGETAVQSYGTLDTAKVLSNLTDNEDTIQNALETLSTSQYNYGTNTDAGLKKAKSMFSSSETSQKFIILLSDGVPNHAVGVSIGTGGLFGPSAKEQLADVIKETKKTIQSMKNSNINLITILTGLGDLSDEDNTTLQTVFGTIENPTEGLLYNINDTDIEKIIKEQIYTEVLEKVQNPMNAIKIVDYFPEDITENFEFSYVGNANLGTVSEKIDAEKRTIEWNVETLKGNEVAKLKYKLKMKDMQNTALLNKVISTNEKVVLTYQDIEDKDYTVTLTTSPSIKLSEVKEVTPPAKNEEKKDNTTAPGNLPQTGFKTTIIASLIVISIIAICTYTKSKNYKDIK